VGKFGKSMSQLDMVVAQWSFVGPMFAFPERVGFAHATDEELIALAHQMYWIGAVLGVRRELNLCGGDLDEVRAYCKLVCSEIINPCLENPSQFEEGMAEHLLEGCALINPFIDGEAFRPFMYRRYGVASWKERAEKDLRSNGGHLMFALACWLFEELLTWPLTAAFLRPALNFLMRANINSASLMAGAVVREHRRKKKERACRASNASLASMVRSAAAGFSFSILGLFHYTWTAMAEALLAVSMGRLRRAQDAQKCFLSRNDSLLKKGNPHPGLPMAFAGLKVNRR